MKDEMKETKPSICVSDKNFSELKGKNVGDTGSLEINYRITGIRELNNSLEYSLEVDSKDSKEDEKDESKKDSEKKEKMNKLKENASKSLEAGRQY